MNQRLRTGWYRADRCLHRVGGRLAQGIAALDGFGLILFFWAVVVLLLGGLVTLVEGVIVWRTGLVLVGLMMLRLWGQLLVLGRCHLRLFDY